MQIGRTRKERVEKKLMSIQQTVRRVLTISLAVLVGAIVLFGPPVLVRQYRAMADSSPILGYLYLALVVVLLAALLIMMIWLFWRRGQPLHARPVPAARPTPAEQQQQIQRTVADAKTTAATAPDTIKAGLVQSAQQLETKIEEQTLEIVAFGTISSGKSSLLNALAGESFLRTDPKGGTTVTRNEVRWPTTDKVYLVDTPGIAEINGDDHQSIALQAARNADLILFVIDGALKDFEMRALRALARLGKRIVLCLNKEDWLSPQNRAILVEQLTEQTAGLVAPEDIVTVRAQPAQRIRICLLPDGSEQEEVVTVAADVRALAERMLAIIEKDGKDLLLANLLLRSQALVSDAKAAVREQLDRRAHEIVKRYMWSAGGVAALMPLPGLDILGSATVSFHMVLQLARVYNRTIDLNTARQLVGQVSKFLVGTAGAALATPTLAGLAGAALKAVPVAGTLAGGIVQGLVQVLITRWIGLVFIDYFRAEETFEAPALDKLALYHWQRVTRPEELFRLVQDGTAKLTTRQEKSS